MNKLKSEHVLENSKEAIKKILGGNPTKLDREPTLGEMGAAVSEVRKIELDGVCEYSAQFVKFISGYKLGELPYILAGMRLALRSLYNSIPAGQQKVCEKYKQMNELVKATVRTTVEYSENSEGDSDA